MNDGATLTDRVDGLLHEETQVHDGGLDVTVADILSVEHPGRIDFGGDELTLADLQSVEMSYRHADDDYAWWHLDAGQYLLEYNESLTGDSPLLLQPRTELREQGVAHSSLFVTELGRIPISVGGSGVKIKENARVSTLSFPP